MLGKGNTLRAAWRCWASDFDRNSSPGRRAAVQRAPLPLEAQPEASGWRRACSKVPRNSEHLSVVQGYPQTTGGVQMNFPQPFYGIPKGRTSSSR